jgi:hypothetical protein
MPKRLDPPPWRIRIKRLHESWCAVAGSFFFAESSDPTTHEYAGHSHKRMAESFGNVPISHRAPAEYNPPPNRFMVFREHTERRPALTECVSDIAGRSVRGSSSHVLQLWRAVQSSCMPRGLFLFLQVSFWCKWDGDAASLIEICLQQCTCPYDAHGNEKR